MRFDVMFRATPASPQFLFRSHLCAGDGDVMADPIKELDPTVTVKTFLWLRKADSIQWKLSEFQTL